MNITYFYSACVKISSYRCNILCDPWFTEPIYDGSWYHFPKVHDPLEKIGQVDLIYISHIHPDHYDKVFLKKYFERYGVKKIIIGDWDANYLLRSMNRDGFSPLVIKRGEEFLYEDLRIQIFPQDGESKSDLDSALIVKETKDGEREQCVVNANDIIFDDKTISHIKSVAPNIDLLMLSYTGAGPYPQTFYEIDDSILHIEAKKKKEQFFERYKNVVQKLNPRNTLPFAGKYILGGYLSVLNDARGVSDPVEVASFDDRALIPSDMGGEINLNALEKVSTRIEPYSSELFNERLSEIKYKKFDYETAVTEEFIKNINFVKLLELSYLRALKMSECEIDYFYSFRLPIGNYVVMNANRLAEPYYKCINDKNELPKVRTELQVHFNYLLGLLIGVYHWDNARIGSHVFSRRIGTHHNKSAERFLNFLHI